MRKFIIIVVIAFLITFGLFYVNYINSSKADDPIRVGWQPPWVNQGQITVILQKTDILQDNNVEAKFIGFSFGPPMTEAALAGQLDIIFLGDQPAFNLISKDKSWKIIAPLVYYKSAILVPIDSEIQSLQDLQGKTIATGIGSTTYRDTIQILKEQGIDKQEVTIKNLDVGGQLAFMQSSTKSWGEIDAIAAYDPTVTLATSKGLARPIKEYKSLGVIAVNKKFYDNRPQEMQNFLKSVKEAFEYYQKNSSQANQWYSETTLYSAPNQLYEEMAALEPKMQENTEVKIQLDEETKRELQKHLDIAIQLGLINDLKIEEIIN